MSVIPVIQSPDQNILTGAMITADAAPLASYDLTTLAANDPAQRVLWGTSTVTITFTIGSPLLGEVLIIPVTNLDSASSPTVLRLTNSAGLDVDVPIPTMTRNRIPMTISMDLTQVGSPSDLLANVWNLVVTGNSLDVVFGGAVAIYGPKTQYSVRGVSWDATDTLTPYGIDTPNDYGTRYRLAYQTQTRSLTVSKPATGNEPDEFAQHFAASFGPFGTPGIFWPDPSVPNDAWYGVWRSPFSKQRVAATPVLYRIQMIFDELSKGKPV